MSDLFELDLLRKLIRGQVHRMNNTLTTLEFAVAAFVPKESQDQLSDLSKEIVRDLSDLRAVTGASAQNSHLREELLDVLEKVFRLLGNMPGQRPPITHTCPSGLYIEPEPAWALTRLLTALLSIVDADSCSGLEIVVIDSTEFDITYSNWTQSVAELRDSCLNFAHPIAKQLGAVITSDVSADSMTIQIRSDLQDTKAKAERVETAPLNVPLEVRKLLIVEDSMTLRTLYAKQFSAIGIEVMTAKDCHEALSLVATKSPDCALIDANLDGESGVTLAVALKRKFSVPVVLMSGDIGHELREAAAKELFGFLQKPFKAQQFFDLLNNQVPKGKC